MLSLFGLESVFDPQAVHGFVVVSSLYVPAAQAVQAVSPAFKVVPTAHELMTQSLSASEPAGDVVSSGHDSQFD